MKYHGLKGLWWYPELSGRTIDKKLVFVGGVPEAYKTTMNYHKKTGFNLNQSRHCAYVTFSVKTWFLKILSVVDRMKPGGLKARMSFTYFLEMSYAPIIVLLLF